MKFVTTRRELRFEHASGKVFCVALVRDEEFGTWEAHASVSGFNADGEDAALESLRSAAGMLIEALGAPGELLR